MPDTETNKETDKKNDCTELCGGAAQRQIPTQIAVELSADLGRVVWTHRYSLQITQWRVQRFHSSKKVL